MKRLMGGLFLVHLLLCAVLIVTMDSGFEGATASKLHNALIDGYEAIGLGMVFLGMALVTAILGALWIWARRD